LLAAACTRGAPPLPPGELLATDYRLGHRLRDGGLPSAREVRKARVVIVGGGIGGLSAAWRLQRAGMADIELLELEASPGGNARWGESAVCAYPWGAHYVPLPTQEARATRWLLSDLGVLLGDPDAAEPRYEERALVHAPQERHYRHGTWSEGLVGLEGRTQQEKDEWQRFQARMQQLRNARGRDGRRAFAIPLEHSTQDPELLALDRITFEAWLRREGFVSEPVHWMANYACRDDYGCDYRQASAWAGVHYFACRSGVARHAEQDSVLTWPEGNGWLVRRLMERAAFTMTPGALVFRIEERPRHVRIEAWLAREQRSIAIEAEHVVWAAPFAFAAHALAGTALAEPMRAYQYTPWVTANLTLSELPHERHGAPLSWDNVLHEAASLGYIVATHQSVAVQPGATVLTWYLPLAHESPSAARQRLLATGREHWAGMALAELSRPHPEIRSITRRVDVMAHGHAMVLPHPGLVWGAARQRINAHRGRLHFAHADASGLSLFEEANDRGVAAAETILAAMGSRQPSLRYERG